MGKPYGYVVMVDKGLSGWGMAVGGRSIYALEVSTEDEAYIVIGNAKSRSEMRRIRFAKRLPRLGTRDHMTIANRERAPRWYQNGGF